MKSIPPTQLKATDSMHTTLNMQRRDFQKLTISILLFGLAGCDSDASPPVDVLQIIGDLKRANNQFAVQFLKNIETFQPGENQVLSPFSIESALLMTMEGARNQTADEMGETLGLPASLKGPVEHTPWQLNSIRNDMKALLQITMLASKT